MDFDLYVSQTAYLPFCLFDRVEGRGGGEGGGLREKVEGRGFWEKNHPGLAHNVHHCENNYTIVYRCCKPKVLSLINFNIFPAYFN